MARDTRKPSGKTGGGPRQVKAGLSRISQLAQKRQKRDSWAERTAAKKDELRKTLPPHLDHVFRQHGSDFESSGIPHGTFEGWTQLGKDHSTLPRLDGLVVAAEMLGLTLDFLVGRTASDPALDLADALASRVGQIIAERLSVRTEFVAAVLPAGRVLLDVLVERFGPEVAFQAREKLVFDELQAIKKENELFRAREKEAGVNSEANSYKVLDEALLNVGLSRAAFATEVPRPSTKPRWIATDAPNGAMTAAGANTLADSPLARALAPAGKRLSEKRLNSLPSPAVIMAGVAAQPKRKLPHKRVAKAPRK